MRITIDQIAALSQIAVTSGQDTNTSKTTLSKHLKAFLRSHGIDAKHIMIDLPGHPSDGEDLRLTGDEEDFKTLSQQLSLLDPDQLAIMDFGGHPFENYMNSASVFGDRIHNRASLYIVPVMTNIKEQVILGTIQRFIDLGVSPSKIIIVFTRVENEKIGSRIGHLFPGLHATASKLGFRICSEPIFFASIIAEATGTTENLFELADMLPEDLQRQLRESRKAGGVNDLDIVQKMTRADQAVRPARNLRKAFAEILDLKSGGHHE